MAEAIQTTDYRGSGDFNENVLLLQNVQRINQLITSNFSQEDYGDFDAYLNQVQMGIFSLEALTSDLQDDEFQDAIDDAEDEYGHSMKPRDRIKYLRERFSANIELLKRRGIWTFEAEGGFVKDPV